MIKTLHIAKKLAVLAAIIMALSSICDFGYTVSAQEGSLVNFTGTIVRINGDVKIHRAQQKDWIAAKYGMELGAQDQIMTGAGSSADIEFIRNEERSKVRILEKADMSLMTLNLDKVTGDSEILLDLAIGHIIIKTDHLKGKSRFEVLTPTSMTAVRGTGFEVNVVKEEKGPAANSDVIQ